MNDLDGNIKIQIDGDTFVNKNMLGVMDSLIYQMEDIRRRNPMNATRINKELVIYREVRETKSQALIRAFLKFKYDYRKTLKNNKQIADKMKEDGSWDEAIRSEKKDKS